MLGRVWFWLVLGIIALITVVPQFFKTKAFYALVMYGVVVVFNHIMGDGYYASWPFLISDISSLVFYGGVYYYLFHGAENKTRNVIMYFLLFVIVFTSIGTYFADKSSPDIVRAMVLYSNKGADNSPFYRMGVCHYSMPHALPVLIAPFFLWLKSNRIKRKIKYLMLLVLLFLLLLVWTSGATTPLLISVFALFVSLFIGPQKTYKNNLLILAIVFAITIPLLTDEVQLEVIHYLEGVVPEENANYGKLQDFENNIIYGEASGDMAARSDLYGKSISAFLNNMVLGTNNKLSVGGHSVILDRFAMLGIVGMLPFLLFFYYLFKDMYYNTPSNRRIFILIGIICFVLMLLLKNILGMWMYTAVFVMLPLMVNNDSLGTENNT